MRFISRRLVLPLLAAVATSYSLSQSMVGPALEPLRDEFGSTHTEITWVLIGFLLASAVATPVLGRVGDQLGKGRTIAVTTAVLAVGSVVCAVAPNLQVLVAGRVLQGVGGATLPLAFGIIRELLPSHRVGEAVGAIAAVTSVGGALGVLVAGPILDHLGTTWLFWLPAIANGLVAIALLAGVPHHSGHGAKFSWAAVVAMSGFLVGVLGYLSLGSEHGWASGEMLTWLAVGLILGVVWVWIELRSDSPVIDMRLMRARPVWTANLSSFMFGISLYSAFGFIPSFLQLPTNTGFGLGASVTESGLLFVPMTVAMLASGLSVGLLTRRVGLHLIVVGASLLPVAGYLGLALSHGHFWQIALATTIQGLGFGIALSALSALVVATVPHSQTASATGMNANIRTIGGAAGAAAVGAILGSHQLAGFPSEQSYTVAFLGLAGASLLGALVALTIPAHRAHNEPLPALASAADAVL